MSVRLRIFSNTLTAIFFLNAVCMAMGFMLFWFAADPYTGGRLSENANYIAIQYFSLGAIVVLALSGIGALWVIAVTVRHVTGPLRKLKRAASEIQKGNLNYELPVTGHDEFAELASAFERMRVRIKDSMRQQEKSETERRDMMAYVTHDLKTPITAIMGYSEGILDGVADTSEKIREYVTIIHRKARNLQSLAEDLSLLSRLENAQLPLDKKEEDLAALVSELAFEFSHDEPGMRLKTHLTQGLRVLIDRQKMARVLINLFQNSAKYKKPEQPGPEVSLSLTQKDGTALLMVSDNGMGVAQSDITHLFERFYRADESRGRQSGSGMGLTIARELVHLHGGKIWIVNNSGGGISVNIALPLSNVVGGGGVSGRNSAARSAAGRYGGAAGGGGAAGESRSAAGRSGGGGGGTAGRSGGGG
ncbi:MAG: HAMP domain-containing histidine kinase, partial [Oscillospiraceae bacterium]|nr:HAMP domain-containing histidine kinase [Oscillospiraceae bacterium]